ncbi:MAG: cytochrome C [Paracoccaceae bacterium]|nr:cytochrome C [Paracoccaceae bacterium]MDE3120178.1 cytochrome C [Paracoccaceae bacterium]
MKTPILAAFALTIVAGPALAAGDAAKGAQDFMKCKACHSIIKDDGTAIVKGGILGPNLYGVIGRPAASGKRANNGQPFTYGPGLKELGQKGVVWTEDLVAEYVKNPTAFVKSHTGDAAARSNMAFMLSQGGEDVAAYLASVGPAAK